MEGCPEAGKQLVSCDYLCQFFTVSRPYVTSLSGSVDVFGPPHAHYLRFPELAVPERPPKHST